MNYAIPCTRAVHEIPKYQDLPSLLIAQKHHRIIKESHTSCHRVIRGITSLLSKQQRIDKFSSHSHYKLVSSTFKKIKILIPGQRSFQGEKCYEQLRIG